MKNKALIALAVIIVLTACYVNVGTASPETSLILQSSGVVQQTSTPTQTPNPTPTPTPTPSPTATPTPTPTPTTTPTPTQTPNPTPTPTPTGSYSYSMDISGSNYQILNSASTVIYTSTSSSTAFNHMTNLLTSGNTVYIAAGAYSVTASWGDGSIMTWANGVSNITFTFAPGAVLTAANNLNAPVLMFYGCNNIVVNGITINGNGANQNPENGILSSPQGIVAVDSSNVLVENSVIYNSRVFGITFASDSATTTAYTNDGVTGCTIYCNYGSGSESDGWNGIQLGNNNYCTKFYAENNNIYGWSDVGISAIGLNWIVTENNIHDMNGNSQDPGNGGDAKWGIADEGGGGSSSSSYAQITQNTISNCGSGVAIDNGASLPYVLISGNTLTNCNIGGGSGGSIYLVSTASYCIVESNSITGPSNPGINIMGASNTDVYGNTYSNCTTNYTNSGTGTTTTKPPI